jgi:hypothetical protein
MRPVPLPLDAGLLERLREAGRRIAWRPARPRGRSRGATTVRLARLGDEEARVETREDSPGTTVEVTAGPVGAVVLLLEADRRGPPTELGSRNAGRAPAFPGGSIVVGWGTGPLRADSRPTVHDLVELARYALV